MRLSMSFLLLLSLPVWAGNSHVRADLKANRESIQKGEPFYLGVHLKMSDHWHTYWENPGFAGLPTTLKIEAVPGLMVEALEFPWPKRFVDDDTVTFGYDDEVLLTARAVYNGDAPQITIEGVIDWLECKVMCVPGKHKDKLTLVVRESKPAHTELFDKFRALIPKDYAEDTPFTFSSQYQFESEAWQGSLAITPKAGQAWPKTTDILSFYPLKNEEAELKNADLQIKENSYVFALDYEAWEEELPADLAIGGIVRLVTDKGALFVRLSLYPPGGVMTAASKPVSQAPPAAPEEAAAPAEKSWLGKFWHFAIFALIGGMILNLMPCVLPVLSLKVFALINEAGESTLRRIRMGWVYTLGIMASFMVMSLFFIGSKAAGAELGIGFQLGNPRFVVFLVVLVFLMALIFFGVFHVGAPNSEKLHHLSQRSGAQGAFFMGALMTVLSTPCTAPFLGAAYGWALSQNTFTILVMFQIIAFGLALPYLVLCYMPALLKFLPKPGPWMNHFKITMGFFMLGTMVWLLGVLGTLAGGAGVIGVMTFMLILGQGAYIFGQSFHTGSRLFGLIAMVALIILGYDLGFHRLWNIYEPMKHRHKEEEEIRLAYLSELNTNGGVNAFDVFENKVNTPEETFWIPYSPDNLEYFRNKNRLVFLDFTASWCLTCKANERLVIDTKPIRQLFAAKEVLTMKGDYTEMSDEHTAFIRTFRRAGVPLYVVYPGQDPPILLPETITRSMVIDAVEEADVKLEQHTAMDKSTPAQNP